MLFYTKKKKKKVSTGTKEPGRGDCCHRGSGQRVLTHLTPKGQSSTPTQVPQKNLVVCWKAPEACRWTWPVRVTLFTGTETVQLDFPLLPPFPWAQSEASMGRGREWSEGCGSPQHKPQDYFFKAKYKYSVSPFQGERETVYYMHGYISTADPDRPLPKKMTIFDTLWRGPGCLWNRSRLGETFPYLLYYTFGILNPTNT